MNITAYNSPLALLSSALCTSIVRLHNVRRLDDAREEACQIMLRARDALRTAEERLLSANNNLDEERAFYMEGCREEKALIDAASPEDIVECEEWISELVGLRA